jgi:trans-L-3-hydroxyproline dehydratase
MDGLGVVEAEVTEATVVRHYRAATRAEVEEAYRSDAGRAADSGYLPFSHNWVQDSQGYLLAVSYRQSSSGMTEDRGATPVAVADMAEEAPRTESTNDVFAPSHGEPAHEQFEPAEAVDGMYAQDDAHVDETAELVEEETAEAETPAFDQAGDGDSGAQDAVVELWASPLAQPVESGEPDAIEPPEAAPTPVVTGRQARLTIQTMDLHAAGEPLRLVRSGFPDVPNLPVLERRAWVAENADFVRKALVQEPRGHRDMYGAILLPPHTDYADMTVLFMHNEGYSTMCGHGVIAITTGLIEEGLFPASEPVTTIRYEVPAGIVAANAATVQLEDGTWAVQGVRFTNVPSYVAATSLAVRPEGVELHGTAAQFGALSVDIAFGGAYYGIVNSAELGLRVVPDQADALRRAGAAITEVLRRDHTPAHPTDDDLGFIYGTIIVDYDPRTSPDGRASDAHIRNATIFANAELDRSPCGSGTSAILAMLHASNRVKVGQEIVNAGITGEHFLGRVEEENTVGPYPAVSTSIAGTAYVTGYSTFIVDSRDPLGDGFLLS